MGDNEKNVSANTPNAEPRQEHVSIIPVSQEVVIDKCVADNCCDGKVHCPFCDTDHFKPTQPTRVRDHLELLHMSYAVQAEDLIIVKCFSNCGLSAGHYHCPYCPSKLRKRYAFTLHLYTHMQKLGKDKKCIVVPDPKNPTTIKGLGPEIHLCKKEECYVGLNATESNAKSKTNQTTQCPSTQNPNNLASTSTTSTTENNAVTDTGPHYHCPLCNLICKRRSPLINHLWRCMERSRSSQPVVDEKQQRAINPDLDEANKLPHPCDVKEIKYHLSIVRTLSDLPIAKCSSPDCDCGNKYHCPLCVEERFKPNYLCHLRLHYFAHWKRRVSYKDYSVLLCNNRCEVLAGRHRVRYHFHCPICGSTRRRRQGFIHHLEICKGHPRNKSRKTKDGINEDSALTSSLVEEEEKEEEAEEEEEEEEEGEGVEEEELLGLDDQFTSDLMMVRDEEAEEEELEKEETEEAGKSKEVEMLVKVENVNITQMEAGNEESTTKMDHCKEIQYPERTKQKKDDKMSNEEMNDVIELHPQTETASQFTKEELYDQVSARLSFKCVDAFREKGNVDEIFSSIALRTGAEWSFAPATIDTMSVHEFVGDLQALASTRDLLFKALVGEVSDEQVKNGLVEKQINSGPMISNTKTQVMDASVQVEDSSFPTLMLQPSMRKPTQPFKPSILNKKSVKKTFSIAAMNPKFMNPVQRKRGRPRKMPIPLEVVDSTNLENGSAKEQNVITVQQAPKPADFFTAMNLGTSCEMSHSPRKRGRPRKIFIEKPVAMEILTDNPIDKANEVSIIDVPNEVNIIDTPTEVSNIITEANQSSIKQISGQGPEKRKRGRPRKDKTLQIVPQTVVIGEERQSVEDIPLTPTSDPVSPDGCSTPKRYSTRGKKIDLSFLTGKNKKEDEKFVIEDGLFCLKKTKLDPSSTSHLFSVKRDLFEKDDNSGHSESTRDNGFGISLSEAGAGVVASKSQFKKKSKAQQPLIMSDVALLPTVRVDIVQKRRRNTKMTNIKNKKTLAKKSNVSYSSHSSERSGENSSSMNDGAALIEGSDAKLTSDDEGLRCHLCKLKGEKFDEISDHLILVHGLDKPLRCDVCERTFEKRFDLQSHINRKHGPFPRMDSLVCFKCGKIFQGTAKLKWHLSFIHKITPDPPPKKKTWPCKQCNYSKKCNLCGKVFSKSNHLVTHVQAVHTKEKAAECTICNKKFNHIRYLRTHMKRHQGIKKHQCPTCGWRFFESNTLKDHMETHKEASKRHYRFTCDYCGQKYISKANFSDHLNKHTGEKPHKCQMCGKGFAFRTMLIKHQIHIHTTEKPFKCSYCERAFKFKAKLLQHNVIHTGVSKYVCQCCNKPFSCAATLKHHQPRCRGNNSSWPQNKTVTNESVTLMVDDLTLEQQQQTQQPPPQAEIPETVEIPVEDQGDIVIDMSGLSGMPEGSILQAAAQAAQLMEIPEVFMCSECNAVFSSLADAEEHVTSLHTDVVAVASTGVVEGSATELKTVEEPAASTEYVDATTTAESGST